MKVGIIGCGGIANVHAWVLDQMEDVEIVGLCDVDEEKAKALKGNLLKGKGEPVKGKGELVKGKGELVKGKGELVKGKGEPVKGKDELLKGKLVKDGQGIVTYSNWREMLDSDVDVVHVCTPHYLHAPMALECLKAGKAVFVEKPCGISMKEFEELKKEEERHPGKLGFCFQNRYNETTILLDKLISGGRIGEVIGARAFVTWRRDEGYYLDSPWKGKLDTEGGGVLINQSIHTLDLLLRYLGEPIKVEGSISNHHLPGLIEVEDTLEAWMEFPEGKRACFYASNGYATDAPILLDVQGTRGRICMNGSEISIWPVRGKVERYVCEQEKGIGKSYWGCGHRACIRDFYRTLSNGQTFQNCLAAVENTFVTTMKIYGRD